VISRLEAVGFEPPLLEIRVRCSKGTYVRTLAEDIGKALGSCAHLSALRRTGAGTFSVADALTPDALASLDAEKRAARIIGLGALMQHFPRADLDPGAEARFRNGQVLARGGLGAGICAVFATGGEVIGLGLSDGAGQLRPLRLTASQAADKHRKNL
jgi:tRNA pseudouridine55 synthase